MSCWFVDIPFYLPEFVDILFYLPKFVDIPFNLSKFINNPFRLPNFVNNTFKLPNFVNNPFKLPIFVNNSFNLPNFVKNTFNPPDLSIMRVQGLISGTRLISALLAVYRIPPGIKQTIWYQNLKYFYFQKQKTKFYSKIYHIVFHETFLFFRLLTLHRKL